MNFIDQLNYDIQQKQINNNDSKLFIKNKNLTKYSIKNKNENIINTDLPIGAYLGSIFLIKDNNIIQCYCWCDWEHSMYLQICEKNPKWIGNINVINLEKAPYVKKYLHDKKILHLPSNYHHVIIELLKYGFQLYIKK
jgi:hypothetical protein